MDPTGQRGDRKDESDNKEANIQVTARGSSGASSLALTGICVIPRVKAGRSTLEIPHWKAFLHNLVTIHGDQMCARGQAYPKQYLISLSQPLSSFTGF